jgi:hypothetical protein
MVDILPNPRGRPDPRSFDPSAGSEDPYITANFGTKTPPTPDFTTSPRPGTPAPYKPPELPTPREQDPRPDEHSHLSPGEMERALEDLRARGYSEQVINEALGNVDPSTSRKPAAGFDLPYSQIPAVAGMRPAELAALNTDLSATLAAMKVAPAVAPSLAKELFASMQAYEALPTDAAKELFCRTEQYRANEALPGAVDEARAIIEVARAKNPVFVEDAISRGLFAGRRVLVQIAMSGRLP